MVKVLCLALLLTLALQLRLSHLLTNELANQSFRVKYNSLKDSTLATAMVGFLPDKIIYRTSCSIPNTAPYTLQGAQLTISSAWTAPTSCAADLQLQKLFAQTVNYHPAGLGIVLVNSNNKVLLDLQLF